MNSSHGRKFMTHASTDALASLASIGTSFGVQRVDLVLRVLDRQADGEVLDVLVADVLWRA